MSCPGERVESKAAKLVIGFQNILTDMKIITGQ